PETPAVGRILESDNHTQPPIPSPRGGGLGRGQQAKGLPNQPRPKPQTPQPLADLRTFQTWLKQAEQANPRL
ncbi:MAG TPA: hypothetical protein PLK27_05845, partial [Neisseria sp.]|nr:hypothetical protein [Neisseria sp.]